jgi:hypothetical protein
MGVQFSKSLFSGVAWLGLWLLAACAAPQPAAAQPLQAQTGPYELEVLVGGVAAKTFLHEGETHVLGRASERYMLRVHNRSSRRIEAVVSVDGLDVIDGKPGDYTRKRGYLVPAYGSVDIDGWRVSEREAAAFRFGAIQDSYAARTGRPRNIGVIGVAVFPERELPIARPYVSRDGYRRSSPLADDRAAEREAPPPAAAPAASSLQKSEARGSAESSGAGAPRAEARRSRSGLGTEFGEALSSQITEVPFKRANATTPTVLIGARYNDRAGLLALGIDVDGCGDEDLALRQSASPFPVAERRYARPPSGWRRDY